MDEAIDYNELINGSNNAKPSPNTRNDRKNSTNVGRKPSPLYPKIYS